MKSFEQISNGNLLFHQRNSQVIDLKSIYKQNKLQHESKISIRTFKIHCLFLLSQISPTQNLSTIQFIFYFSLFFTCCRLLILLFRHLKDPTCGKILDKQSFLWQLDSYYNLKCLKNREQFFFASSQCGFFFATNCVNGSIGLGSHLDLWKN